MLTARLIHWFRAWARYRQSLRELAQLDDRYPSERINFNPPNLAFREGVDWAEMDLFSRSLAFHFWFEG